MLAQVGQSWSNTPIPRIPLVPRSAPKLKPVLAQLRGTAAKMDAGSPITWIGRLAAVSPASLISARRTEPQTNPLAKCPHSPTCSPFALVTDGSASAGLMTDAASRNPNDPVSTRTWSTVRQSVVPGTHTVTVTNGELIALPSGPRSRVIASVFATGVVTAGGGGDTAAFESLEPPPPQPARTAPSAKARMKRPTGRVMARVLI